MMNKKVASIAISASLVAGGIGIPATLVYAKTLPKTLIEYSDGKQVQSQSSSESAKVFNINIKYVYGNKVIKNETQQVGYDGNIKLDIPSGYKEVNVNGTDNYIQSNGTVTVHISPITYEVNYYVKYDGSYLREGTTKVTQKGIGNAVNLIKGNLIPNGYEFSSATINGENISESDLQNLYASSNSTVIININKKTYNFDYTFKNSQDSIIKKGSLTYQIGNSIADLTELVPKGYEIGNNDNLDNYNMFGKSSLDILVTEITHNIDWQLVNSLTDKEISSGTKTINELNGDFNGSTLIPNGYIYVASKIDGVYSTLDELKSITNESNSNVVIAVEKASDIGLVTTKTNNEDRTATITYNDPNAKSISLVVGNNSAALENSGNGVWTVTVPLPDKGTEFLYKFIVDGKSELGHGVKSIGDNDIFSYTPLLNTINYDVTCGGNSLNKGILNIDNSNNVTDITEVIPSGYKFVSATVNGEPASEEDITSIPDSNDCNVHIYVESVYNKLSYEVKCGDKTLETNSLEVDNTDYTSNLSTLIPSGYKFVSATDNGKSIVESDLASISNSTDNDIIINIEPITYSTNVNFYNSETGDLIKTENLNYTVNENINLQDIGNVEGYTFKYVKNDGVVLGGTNITEFSGSEVGTLSIYESPNKNTLSIKMEDSNSVVSTKSIQVTNNNDYTNLTDIIPKEYEATTLNINGTYVNVDELSAIPNSTYGNIVVKIQPKEYKLTFIDSSTGDKVSSDLVYEISDKGKCDYTTLVPTGYKVVSLDINGVKTNDTLDNIPIAAGDITVYVENEMRTLSVEMLDGRNPIYNVSSQVSDTDTTDVANEVPQGYEIVSATDNGAEISTKDLSKVSDSNNNDIVINVKPVTSTLKVPVYDSENGWLITTETLSVNVDKEINIEDIAKVNGYKFDYAEVNDAKLTNVKTITGVGMKNFKIYLTPDNTKATLSIKTESGQVLSTDTLTGYSSETEDLTSMIPTGYTLDKLVSSDNKTLSSSNVTLGDLNNATLYVSKTKYNVQVNFYDEITGKVIDTKTLTYTYGEPVDMTDFVKTNGYIFDYLDSNGVHILDESMSSFNATRWIQGNNLSVYMIPNTISKSIKWVNSKDGTTVTTSTVTGDSTENVDITKLCPTGYTIKSIDNYNKVSSNNTIELSKIDGMVIQIKPVIESLKVNYIYNSKTLATKTYTGTINETENLTSNVPSGYSVKSVDVNGKSVNVDELKNMALSNSTVTVNLAKNPTTISVECIDSNTNKEISNKSLTTNSSSLNLTSYIPKGYEVTSVDIGDITTTESALQDVNPDKGSVKIYVQPTSVTGTVSTKYADGKLSIYFTNTTATEVAVNINVNGWSLYNMTNEGNGLWEATVSIPSGVDSVEYNFKVDNASWTTGKGNDTQDDYNIYKIEQNNKEGNATVTELGNGNVEVSYTNVNAKTVSLHYLSNNTWTTKEMTDTNGTFSAEVPLSQSATQLEFKFIINGSDWVIANGISTSGSGVYENNIYTYGESAFEASTSKTTKESGISGVIKNISSWLKGL